MATGGLTQTAENRVYLFRLQILIIDGGLLVLRNILDQTLCAQGIPLRVCLYQEKSAISRLKSRGIITQAQYDQLFPTVGQDPTTSDLDITLIIFLLRCLKCVGLNKKFDWKATPISTDVTLEADICRLKAFRNEISHISKTTCIQPNDFVNWWNDIEQILVRLSSPALNIQQTIADFKTCPLDPKKEKWVQKEIKKLKEYEADVHQLKEDVTYLKVRFTEVEKNQEEVKRRLDEERTSSTFLSSVQTEEENYQRREEDETSQDRQTSGNIFQRICEELHYCSMKSKFQGDLIKFYRNRCSSIPLSPLLEEIETPLAGFYVMPNLVAVKQKSPASDEEVRTPINSLRGLLSTENEEEQQEIYISADAGFGKTAFSKYLAMTWCQAHSKDRNRKFFKDKELKALSMFKFLFLVLLRDCTSVCDIDDMIEQQIIRKLPSSASLDKVLFREKCLIILDGLDEWTHPHNGCSEVTEQIPHRYVRENCVILTTTRPWKLGVSNLKSSQLNKKVELVQLSADSTRQLERNAIRKMTGVFDEKVLKSKIRNLDTVISDRGLKNMKVIPLLLMYIICLWCNDFSITNSKHEIYTNIIEFLLSRTSRKHPEVQSSCELSANEIPEYFKNHEFCKKFYSLINSLADLACQTLFNETRENTLVFDRSVAEKYLKADDMKLGLLSGILSESRCKTLMREIIKVSFSHKTVQEFFAAISISSQSGVAKNVVEKCRNVQDILDICEFVFKMNAGVMCALSNDLMSVVNEDKETCGYRTRTGVENLYSVYNSRLYKMQNMFQSFLNEVSESENIQLCLQDFFIDKNTVENEQLQQLSKQNKNNIKSLLIDTRNTFRSLREIIDLFSLEDLSHIQKVYYDGYRETEEEINLILFPSLQNITLFCGILKNNEESLSENFANLQNLQYLFIGRFTLSHNVLETIFSFISGQKCMKKLTLEWLYCAEHRRRDCQRWNLDLSRHSTLTKLKLQELPWLQLNITTPSLENVYLAGINLDESSLLLSRGMLNIERFDWERIDMPAQNFVNFVFMRNNLLR